MADIFRQGDIRKLLKNRIVWIFGDSNMRALYKDIVCLLQKNEIISHSALRTKLENHFMNDNLLKGTTVHRGRNYVEERRYCEKEIALIVDFMFLTKCLTEDLKTKFESLKGPEEIPDLVVINSCLWDICRWGPNGVNDYKKNILVLLDLFKKHLGKKTLVIWATTPPVASEMRGGLIIKQIEFMQYSVRFEVMEANLFVRDEFVSRGYDLLDVHYHLLLQIHRRNLDGIHWLPETVRHITNLLLTHVSISWGVKLPGNFHSSWIDQLFANAEAQKVTKTSETTLKQLTALANNATGQKVNENKTEPNETAGKGFEIKVITPVGRKKRSRPGRNTNFNRLGPGTAPQTVTTMKGCKSAAGSKQTQDNRWDNYGSDPTCGNNKPHSEKYFNGRYMPY